MKSILNTATKVANGNGSETPPDKRANDLNGTDWTRYSMSVWRDIVLTPEERSLQHPAMFPLMLVDRLIRCYTKPTDTEILDPFMGSGSTLVAAHKLKRHGIGFDVYDKYIELAKSRFNQMDLFGAETPAPTFICDDSRNILKHLRQNSVDFCVTSPPYWDILKQKRTADAKAVRNYGDSDSDLGTMDDYERFLDGLQQVFEAVFAVLKPKKYCAVNVMDLRKQSRFFCFHCDLAKRLEKVGFLFDDLFIWDRGRDYNNLRSLGYPYVFRLNKIHEFILIFQKPNGIAAASEDTRAFR
jgi:DNA modification methylase